MSFDANRPTDSRLALPINRVAVVLLTGVVVVYAGLIGLGQWQADEYANFAALRTQGWHFFFNRLRWSPRPISELILSIYGWTVNQLHQPLIVPFLGLLWSGFIGAGLLTFFQTRGKRSKDENLLPRLAAMALLASFLTGGGLTEAFYWPVGAVAYLMTLSSTLLFFWQAAQGRLAMSEGRTLCSIALIVAGCSSEVGAMFVACYALIRTAELVIRRIPNCLHERADTAILWWLLPGLLSFAVLSALGLNRFHETEPAFTVASSTLGHPLTSGAVGFRELVREILGATPGPAPFRLTSRLPSEILLALGVGLCCPVNRSAKGTARQIGDLIAAFLMACVLNLTSSYLHFGTAGGQRHELLRHCWILMSAAGVGILVFRLPTGKPFLVRPICEIAAPIILCLAVLAPWHIKELFREYRAYSVIARAIRGNFESGFQQGSDEMTYVLPPNQGVLAFAQIEPGTYTVGSGSTFYPTYILKFFRKRSLVVRFEQRIDSPVLDLFDPLLSHSTRNCNMESLHSSTSCRKQAISQACAFPSPFCGMMSAMGMLQQLCWPAFL